MITLPNLRLAIYSYLDDDGTRWSSGSAIGTLDEATPVDRAIKVALFQALRFYSRNGGDGVTVQKSIATDVNGQAELLVQPDRALWISNVSLQENNFWAKARATRADEVEYRDNVVRTIRVNFIPEPSIDAATGDIRFCSDSGLEIPELEQLAVLYSTRNLLPRDNEQNPALQDAVFLAENTITEIVQTPLAVDFPRYGRAPSAQAQYRWAYIRYDAETGKKNVIQIHRPLYSFYDVVN